MDRKELGRCLLGLGNRIHTLARELDYVCERATQNFTPIMCDDAQYIYSRLQQCGGLLQDFYDNYCNEKPTCAPGTVLAAWKVVNGELVDDPDMVGKVIHEGEDDEEEILQ